MKILVYSDGKPPAEDALRLAAHLKTKLNAQLSVITVRPGTHAAEEPPPVGIEIPWTDEASLPVGLKMLTSAISILSEQGIMPLPTGITIQDTAKGHMFVCKDNDGGRVPFYEVFGHFVASLNREIDEHRYDLLIIAPPLRSRLGRIVIGDTTRKLALDLHTSLLYVRGGGPENRYLICADGSLASHRQFPMLRRLMPAIGPPVDLVCVKTPDQDENATQEAKRCLEHAEQWLGSCGKLGEIAVKENQSRATEILQAAGDQSIIMMGASLRHDVYKRMLGSLPMQILDRTKSSVLLVKLPPEEGVDALKMPFECK